MSDTDQALHALLRLQKRLIGRGSGASCCTDAKIVKIRDDFKTIKDTLANLAAERDEAIKDAERWQADALRLLTERNDAMEERDEARRTLCRIGAAMATLDLQEHSRKELGIHALTTVLETNVASIRGWDCFRKDGGNA